MQKDKPVSSNFLVEKRFLVIGFAWILLQVIIFWRFGIVENFEATKYIKEADIFLREGTYSSGNFLFYSVQIMLIAFSKLTLTYPWFPVLFQMAINGISVYCFFQLAKHLGATLQLATWATVFFLAMFFYHSYNVHLFTESLYYSFGIIYTWLLFRINKLNIGNAMLLVIFLTLIYFTRPNGLFFIPVTVVYLILKFYRRRAAALLFTFLFIILLSVYFLLNYALSSGGEFDFLLPFREAHIICGVPTVSRAYEIAVPFNYNSLEGFWYLVTHYPGLFFELAFKKFLAFWGVIRSYYSIAHNVFLGLYFYPLYLQMIKRLPLVFKNYRAEFFYMILIIVFAMLTVLFSCDDWHNRFLLALLPYFILLASARKPLHY